MNYDIPIRVLFRAWFTELPRLASPKLIGEVAGVLATEFEFAQVMRVDGHTGVAVASTALVSQDTGWQLYIAGDSVDLELRWKRKRPGFSFERTLQQGAEAFELIARAAPAQAHRLAVVQEGYLGSMPDNLMQAAAGRLLRYPRSFDPAPFEWDWRCAQVVPRRFAGRLEATNTLATVKRHSGTMIDDAESMEFDRIRVDLDINTVPKNATPRFAPPDVKAYYLASVEWHADLSREMESFITAGGKA